MGIQCVQNTHASHVQVYGSNCTFGRFSYSNLQLDDALKAAASTAVVGFVTRLAFHCLSSLRTME